MRSWTLTTLVLLLGLGVFARAQVDVGAKAPDVKVKEFLNTDIKSMKELSGQLVLMEYFAHW